MILRFCFRKKEIDCASSSLVKRFTEGHTKLPFAVFVGRLANPLSHEAFSELYEKSIQDLKNLKEMLIKTGKNESL
ncbi:hypothetical protein P8452_61348 [Trifolium repens]|nr:hypothetical protein P8452_61348 [Trifolium repens]